MLEEENKFFLKKNSRQVSCFARFSFTTNFEKQRTKSEVKKQISDLTFDSCHILLTVLAILLWANPLLCCTMYKVPKVHLPSFCSRVPNFKCNFLINFKVKWSCSCVQMKAEIMRNPKMALHV